MKLLENVPRMMWGIDKEVTFAQAVECCLAFSGIGYDYDELLCASGMAFSLKWHKGTPCPSAGTVEDPLYMDRLFHYIGCSYKVVWADDAGFGDALDESLDRGMPVIVQGGFNVPDFYVLAGYDPQGPVYYGRTPFDNTDDYAETGNHPIRAIIIVDTNEDMPSGLAKLYYPLHSAVLAYDREPPQDGHEANYEHSLEAYDEWIAQLLNPALWENVDEEKLNLYVHANEWVFDTLYTSRLAAGRYLLRTANFHSRDDSQRIMLAGRMYYVIAKILHQRGFTAFAAGHPEKGFAVKYLRDADNRVAWSGILRQAAEQDRRAHEEIAAVVGGRR